METSIIKSVFPESEAARLTGISEARLRHWNRSSFFVPKFRNVPDGGDHDRLYTFKDLVCLRTLYVLTSEHGIGLPRLRETLKHLFEMDQSRWATEQLYVLGKRVYFDPKDVEAFQDSASTQFVLHGIKLRKVLADLEQAVFESRGRSDKDHGQIVKVRGVVSSNPTIKGTRIRVSTVKSLLEDGLKVAQIQEMYPSLTESDINAAGEFDRVA